MKTYVQNTWSNLQSVAILAKTLGWPAPMCPVGRGAIISSRWKNWEGGAGQKVRGPRPPRPWPRTATVVGLARFAAFNSVIWTTHNRISYAVYTYCIY